MRNNFSRQVKEVFSLGVQEATRLENDFIGPEHLLLGLIKENDNNAIELLVKAHVEIPALKKELESSIHGMKIVEKRKSPRMMRIKSLFHRSVFALNEDAERVVREMVIEARQYKTDSIDSEHMLLSILKHKEAKASVVLSQLGLDYNQARQLISKKTRNQS